MFVYITNPSFSFDPEANNPRTMVGGLSSATKKTNGMWCIHCFRKGQFSWTEYGMCGHCGGETNPNDPEVIEMMKGR